MGTYRDLMVYKKAYQLALEIFITTKKFPKEEKYSLIDQIRRSSRSVCANLAEAFRRTEYKDYFLNKIKDSSSENEETLVWLDFSKDFQYITASEWDRLSNMNDEVGKLLWTIYNNPDKFRFYKRISPAPNS